MEKRWKKLIYILPLIYGMGYIAIFGTNLLVGDDWMFLDDWFAYKNTGDLWTSLWRPLFGHIEVLPKIVQYLTLPFCHWNVKIVMYEMQIFAFLTYMILLKQVELRCGERINGKKDKLTKEYIITAIGMAFCCFGAVHWENFSWAVNIGIVMCFAFIVGCFYYFGMYCDTHEMKNLVFACIFMLMANLCHGTGFAIGIVFAGMFVMEMIIDRVYANKSELKAYLTVIVMLIICVFIYKNTLEGGIITLDRGLFYYISYYFIISGDMFVPGYGFMTPYMYILGGLLGLLENVLSLVILISLIKKNLVGKYRFELCLMAFSVAFRLMVILQRSGLGYESALYSHYALFSVLNIASLILIFCGEGFFSRIGEYIGSLNDKHREKAFINRFMSISYITILTFFLAYSLACLAVSYGSMKTRREKVTLLLNYENQKNEEYMMLGLWSNSDEALSQIKRAEEYRLSAFYDAYKE